MSRRLPLLACLVLALMPAFALAQDRSDRSLVETLERAPRIGDEERFIEFSPFVQLDGGWASSSPRDLVGEADRRNGEVRRGRLYVDFGYGDLGGRLTVDFANLDTAPVTYAYLDYELNDTLTLQAGYQDTPIRA